MRLSRSEVRDHINYRKIDRWPSYRFYRASQRRKFPMRYICEIFGAPDFRLFQHNLLQAGSRSAASSISVHHFVGTGQKRRRQIKAARLGGSVSVATGIAPLARKRVLGIDPAKASVPLAVAMHWA